MMFTKIKLFISRLYMIYKNMKFIKKMRKQEKIKDITSALHISMKETTEEFHTQIADAFNKARLNVKDDEHVDYKRGGNAPVNINGIQKTFQRKYK